MNPDPHKLPDGLAPMETPPRIADHELVRIIGRGSYGQVWLARNVMGSYRAVKVVYRSTFDNERPFDREFRGIQKFEPVSRAHTSQVDILQVGRNDHEGYFYYVMELADDEVTGQEIAPEKYHPKTLTSLMRNSRRLPFEQCLQIGLSLAQALGHLHKNGLIHRDIKPSNIVFVNGVPKLADIGLVTDVGATMSYVGTQGFIPPEGPTTPQSDLYSLGKVLYEISTGKDRQEFPELPTLLGEFPEARQLMEINEIIVKACANDPADRYQTAEEMFSDLALLQGGKSVKRLRLLERRVALGWKAGVVALVLLLLAGGAFLKANLDRKASLKREAVSLLALGLNLMERGDYAGALAMLAKALKYDPGNAEAEESQRMRIGWLLRNQPRIVHLWTTDAPCYINQFSPDSRLFLTRSCRTNAVLRDVLTGEVVRNFFHPSGDVTQAVFDAGGRRIATAGTDGTARLWDAGDGRLIEIFSDPKSNGKIALSPDGHSVAIAGSDFKVRIWTEGGNRVPIELPAVGEKIRSLAFSPDGTKLASGSEDGTAVVWGIATQKKLQTLPHGSWVFSVCFSPDSTHLATGTLDHRVRIWNVESGLQDMPVIQHPHSVRDVRFTRDDGQLISACYDGAVRQWDMKTSTLVPPILQHPAEAICAQISPNERFAATSCYDGSIRIWRVPSPYVQWAGPRVRFAANGLVSVQITNGFVRAYSTVTSAPITEPIPVIQPIDNLFLNREGSRLLIRYKTSDGSDRHILDLDLRQLQLPAVPVRIPAGFDHIQSSDGRTLLLFGGTTARAWSLTTGQPISIPIIMTRGSIITKVALSSDGKLMAIAGTNQVLIMPCDTQTTNAQVVNVPHAVGHMEFSPDGRRLVVACTSTLLEPRSAYVWSIPDGRMVGRPAAHRDGIGFASFSPDGSRFITCGEDFWAAIWETETGRQVSPRLKHFGQVTKARFSPDGRLVATLCDDSTVRVWETFTGRPLCPPLHDPDKPFDCVFLAGEHQLMVHDWGGNHRLWDFSATQHSPDELEEIGYVLSSGTGLDQNDLVPQSSETLLKSWEKLRKLYPDEFSVSPLDLNPPSSQAQLTR